MWNQPIRDFDVFVFLERQWFDVLCFWQWFNVFVFLTDIDSMCLCFLTDSVLTDSDVFVFLTDSDSMCSCFLTDSDSMCSCFWQTVFRCVCVFDRQWFDVFVFFDRQWFDVFVFFDRQCFDVFVFLTDSDSMCSCFWQTVIRCVRVFVTGCGELINYSEEVELSSQPFCMFAVNAYHTVMRL